MFRGRAAVTNRRWLPALALAVTIFILVILNHRPHEYHLSLPPIASLYNSYSSASSQKDHIFREDGLLLVNPSSPTHPISTLIKHAQSEWDAKLARASRTLEDAAREYERRYNRFPPRGFDVWWRYAVDENNVQLPDEYDQIHADLEPFWGIAPADLASLMSLRSFQRWTLVLGKNSPEHPITVLNYTLPGDEAVEKRVMKDVEEFWLSVLRPVQDLLPPFRILYQPHDNANLVTEYLAKEAAENAAATGEYINAMNWSIPNENGWRDWRSACSPTSSVRIQPFNFSEPFPSPFFNVSESLPPPSSSSQRFNRRDANHIQSLPKTFIYSAAASSDPCMHPSHFVTHGFFLQASPHPGPASTGGNPAVLTKLKNGGEGGGDLMLVPQLSTAKTSVNDDILGASAYGWVDASEVNPARPVVSWEAKGLGGPGEQGNDRLLWRGSNTGIWWRSWTRWRESHRARLVELANPDIGSPGFHGNPATCCVINPPNASHPQKTSSPSSLSTTDCTPLPLSLLASSYLDIAFATSVAPGSEPHPVQCDGTLCDTAREEYAWRQGVMKEDEGKWKFILDVDGNGWSGRFKRLMSTGSLIFKATIYPEWYTDRIQPWLHYIPVQMDYSDLFDVMAYFRGELPSSPSSPSPFLVFARDTDTEGSQQDEDSSRTTREEADARARTIADAGLDWSRRFWRREDLTAYQFRLLLEYIRVMSPDRDSPEMSFRYPVVEEDYD